MSEGDGKGGGVDIASKRSVVEVVFYTFVVNTSYFLTLWVDGVLLLRIVLNASDLFRLGNWDEM